MRKISSKNPYSQEVLAQVSMTAVEEIPALIKRSKVAQKLWANRAIDERANMMKEVSHKILNEMNSLAELMAQEMGKPLTSAKGEVKACAALMERESLEIVEALRDETEEYEKFTKTVVFDPLGVSVAITPWNFPLLMPVWQILPALVAGNSVILKPSEETPVLGQRLADLFNEVLPQDVLILVQGDGDQGRKLVESDVQLITFTGSRDTGVRILQAASGGLKRVILELGGKDPLIVLSGADVKAAAQFAAGNGFRNSGQVCVSTERVYVENKVKDQFMVELKEATKNLKIGDSLDAEVAVGPMVNSRQRDLVLAQLQEAKDQGAELYSVESSFSGRGNFVIPTIVENVNHEMSVMKNETFGPVLGVMGFDNVDEAIQLANDSNYGLGAVVFGEPDKAREVARRLDHGMIGVNKGVSGVPNSPWVGAKESGYGFHSSKMGHRQFCQVRVMTESKN